MFRKLSRLAMAATPAFALSIIGSAVLADDQNVSGNKYEDDAWYDVSEWFDGNDYNPTDEAIGRWDDERFDYHDNRTSSDQDNDTETVEASEFYGENYDGGYGVFADEDRDGNYESYSRYYDADNDNLYDSHASFSDGNRDGIYENHELHYLAGKSAKSIRHEQAAKSVLKSLSGKAEQVSGTVTEATFVIRLDGVAQLLAIETDDGKSLWVDLGTNKSAQLFKGDKLTAKGPITKVGDKVVLMATMLETQGQQRKVERKGRQFDGTVKSTRTATVRGEKRTVAKLKTEDGKMLTVDMGSPENNKKIKEGGQVSITGIPVKVGDRVILIADRNEL